MICIGLPTTDRRKSSDKIWPLKLTQTREPKKARVTMKQWMGRHKEGKS